MNPFIRWIANILPSCKTQQASRCQSDSGWAQNETLHTWNLEQSKDSHRQLQCARKTLPDERDLVMGRINTWLLLMSPHTLHHLVQARRLHCSLSNVMRFPHKGQTFYLSSRFFSFSQSQCCCQCATQSLLVVKDVLSEQAIKTLFSRDQWCYVYIHCIWFLAIQEQWHAITGTKNFIRSMTNFVWPIIAELYLVNCHQKWLWWTHQDK